jgi:hypothetical protein
MLLGIANFRATILMKQGDDKTDREISNDESAEPGQTTLSSDIEQEDFDIQ